MQLKLFKLIAIYSILSLLGSCMNTSDEYITDRHTHANTSSLSIVEARYRTVNLLLSFYNVLTRDFGVGEWVPQSVQAQVQENFDIDCPTGYISETYRLAYAGPFIRQNWEDALKKCMKWLNHMVLTLQSLIIVFLEDLPRYSLI